MTFIEKNDLKILGNLFKCFALSGIAKKIYFLFFKYSIEI